MVTRWDREFDKVCGASITSRDTDPLEDSGVWDILHGTRIIEATEEMVVRKGIAALHIVGSESIQDDPSVEH